MRPRTPAYERLPRTAPAANIPTTKNTGVCQENNLASGSVLYSRAPATIQTMAAKVPWLDFIVSSISTVARFEPSAMRKRHWQRDARYPCTGMTTLARAGELPPRWGVSLAVSLHGYAMAATSEPAPPLLAHGAEHLSLVTVDTYNAELRSSDGFVGDRASKRAFQAILDEWRERLRKFGEDPLGEAQR